MHVQNYLKKFSNWYFSKQVLPYWAILLLDTFIVFICSLSAYWVQYRTGVMYDNRFAVLYTSLMYALLSWVGARIFKTYSGVVRYSGMVDLLKIAYANLVTLALALGCSCLFKGLGVESLSALSPLATVGAMILSTMLMWVVRIVVKSVYDQSNAQPKTQRALVYGAMSGGVALAKNIRAQRPVPFDVVGFLSHEKRMNNMKLLGATVYGVDYDIASLIRKLHVQAVIVSPQWADEFRHNQAMQDVIIGEGCKIYMGQDAKESDGQDEEVRLTEVSVEDLLPRQQIRVDMQSVGEQLRGKRVMITGSAGSIGSEIVRQVAQFKPSKMMLIDQAETPQHDIRLMMKSDFPDVDAETVVASISRRTRMEDVFSRFQPDYVFHAAAYKHVPMMEDNPSEAVMNNVYGTKVIADLAVKYGTRKFVMISTDKAVNPTNVMGASKRICEIYVQSLDRKLKLEAMSRFKTDGNVNYTQFVTTRFGNVLGSNGSVIPLFREQIRKGGPVTVTDERITRYFMLIPEACKLVLEAGTKGNGGEIFVFDMGEPVRIADLAKRMIAMSHAQNVEIKYTGLREGEKLYEEVLNELEGTKPTFHEKIRIAQVREYDFETVEREVDELVETAKRFDNMETVRKMKQMVPEYKSNNSVYEVLDK